MRPTQGTLNEFVRLLQTCIINNITVVLYLFYCVHGNKAYTQTEIHRMLGTNPKSLRTHNKVLFILKAIDRMPEKGKRTVIKAQNIKCTPPSSLPLIRDILDVQSQRTNAHRILAGEEGDTHKKKKGGSGAFTAFDIAADEDWRKAKESLEKHFKKYEYDPSMLTAKNRFAKLVDLVLDETLDFDAYCKWYAREKYPEKGFNYGLFLFSNMISEFRDTDEREGKYLKTSSRLKNSESHKAGLKRTKEFIDNLGDV